MAGLAGLPNQVLPRPAIPNPVLVVLGSVKHASERFALYELPNTTNTTNMDRPNCRSGMPTTPTSTLHEVFQSNQVRQRPVTYAGCTNFFEGEKISCPSIVSELSRSLSLKRSDESLMGGRLQSIPTAPIFFQGAAVRTLKKSWT